VWDAARGESVAEYAAPRTTRVVAFAANPDGSVGVSADLDGGVTVWDLAGGEPLGRLPAAAVPVTAVAITPDARTVATAGFDGRVTVWDLLTGGQRVAVAAGSMVRALALSPSGDRLLVGAETLAVYDLDDARGAVRLGALRPAHPVTAVTFNPAMPEYALFGGAFGQVAYVRLPAVERMVARRST
jgi:WD40 repeat protein